MNIYKGFLIIQENNEFRAYRGPLYRNDSIASYCSSSSDSVQTAIDSALDRGEYPEEQIKGRESSDTSINAKIEEIENFAKMYIHSFNLTLSVEVVAEPDVAGHWSEWTPEYWHEAGLHPDGIKIHVGTKAGTLDLPRSYYLLRLIPELVRWQRTGTPYEVGVWPPNPQPYIDAVYLTVQWGMLPEYKELFYEEVLGEEMEEFGMVKEDVEPEERSEMGESIARFEEEVLRHTGK